MANDALRRGSLRTEGGSLYVDAQGYLSGGSKRMVETPIGRVESNAYWRNYLDLGGYVTATDIYLESSVQRQSINIDRTASTNCGGPRESRRTEGEDGDFKSPLLEVLTPLRAGGLLNT
jgi:hypothetical protein